MLDLSAPAINQLKGDDAQNLVAFYMNTPGITKAHEWSLEQAPETEVAPPQPNVLRTVGAGASAPGAGGGGGRRAAAQQPAQKAEAPPAAAEPVAEAAPAEGAAAEEVVDDNDEAQG
ncbi:MAG: hypothetical protein EP349_01345 [Alphaproteobacteria bacterium]|nr:MAG: hypothetical protein EP349_01345 [Alphaproteobacteria bacterium]